MTAILNNWQIEDAKQVVAWNGGIVGHSMGIGKTAIAIEAIKRLNESPTLVIVPLMAISVWTQELEQWAPHLTYTVVHGTQLKRHQKLLALQLGEEKVNVILTTYDTFVRDKAYFGRLRTPTVICDEAHRLKNRKTKRFKAVKQHSYRRIFFLTGTPARAGAEDMWTLLHLISPGTFSSYWKFINTFCEVVDGMYGKEIIGPRNATQLRNLLQRRYMVRRTKEQVLPSLPKKTRQVIRVEMDPLQKKLYKQLADDAIAELTQGGYLLTPTALSLLTRLRQVLVSPKILDADINTYGVGLETIWSMWEDSPQDSGVIFTPFPSVAPVVKEFLRGKGERRCLVLRGGVPAEDVMNTVRRFEAQGGFMVVSIKFAESYSLEFCSRCWFLGCEWVPADNDQAEARLDRRTSKKAINSYFLRNVGTVEEAMAMTLNAKARNLRSIFRDYDSIYRTLHGKDHQN